MATDYGAKLQSILDRGVGSQKRGFFSSLQKYLVNSGKIKDTAVDFYKYLGVLPANIKEEGSSKNLSGSAREFDQMFRDNPALQDQAIEKLKLKPGGIEQIKKDYADYEKNHISWGDAQRDPSKVKKYNEQQKKLGFEQMQQPTVNSSGQPGGIDYSKYGGVDYSQYAYGRAPDDPRNKFNSVTGQANPNYNPNYTGTNYTSSTYFNTGDPKYDEAGKALEDFINRQQEAGLALNPNLAYTPEMLEQFMDEAKSQVDPYFQNQIDVIKQDVKRAAPQILENYNSAVQSQREQFPSTLGNEREANAGAGTAFSGGRAGGELQMQNVANRNLSGLQQEYGNSLYDLGRKAESQIGAGNMGGLNLGSLGKYGASITGNGGFGSSGSYKPYKSGGYGIGSIEYEREAAREARRQALLNASASGVVSGYGYDDLFN